MSEAHRKVSEKMTSETNLYRTENYQNYINSFHSKPRVEKSISDVQKKIDDDNDSLNSVAESLNNYLDIKVRTSPSDGWCEDNELFHVIFVRYSQVIDDSESLACSIAEPESEKEPESEGEPMFRWERFLVSQSKVKDFLRKFWYLSVLSEQSHFWYD